MKRRSFIASVGVALSSSLPFINWDRIEKVHRPIANVDVSISFDEDSFTDDSKKILYKWTGRIKTDENMDLMKEDIMEAINDNMEVDVQ